MSTRVDGSTTRAGRSRRSNAALRRLQVAWAMASIEDWLLPVAIAVYAYDVGGAGAAAMSGVVRFLPAAVAAPALSMLADRWPRRRVLCLAYATKALACLAMAATSWASLPLVFVYAFLVAEGLVSVLMQPATSALVPWLARTPAELTAANGSLYLLRPLGVFIGPLTAGVMLSWQGAGAAFALGAALAAIAFVAVLGMTVSAAPPPARQTDRRVLSEMAAGYRLLAQDRSAGQVALLASMQGVVRGVFSVAAVVVAVDLLQSDSAAAGYLHSVVGLGGVLGGLLLVSLLKEVSLASTVLWGFVARTAPFAFVVLVPRSVAVYAAMVVIGVGHTALVTAGLTLLQRLAPDELAGRVLGAVGMATTLGVAVGSAAAAPLLGIFGIRGLLAGMGVLCPVLALSTIRGLRAAESRVTAHDDEIELLRGVPFLAHLPLATLGGAASRLVRRAVPAGTTIIHQGAHGDRFHVLVRGRAEVSIDGTRVSMLGPGDHFGELALLHDVPRLATVRLVEDGEIASITRTDFLTALAVGGNQGDAVAALDPDLVADAAEVAVDANHEDLLTRLPLLRRAGLEDLGWLATQATEVRMPAGQVVYREGDEPDDFWVVVDGAVEVLVDGLTVRTIERGGWFGELGLLHDEPRRATVRSIAPTTLMRVDGAAFLRVAADEALLA